MNQVTRDAILRGVEGAAEAHEAFRAREKHADGLRPIDVFGLIEELQIPLSFTALDDLLGACVRVSSAEVGILVTTQRDLHMQRFTAAHELGHFVLEHEGSFDREVRMPGHTEGRDPREVEADAFAAEFLMPKWLMKGAAQRREWWTEDCLRTPDAVYQLSLRLSASYEATCWGLVSHDFIPRATAEDLIGNGKRVKEVKRKALRELPLDDPWADVWLLGSGDDGGQLDAGPNDIFILDLEERVSGGFRWDAKAATDAGFSLLADTSSFDKSVVGGPARRRLAFKAPPPGIYNLRLPLSRSFSPGRSSSTFRLSVSTVGTRRGNDPLPLGATAMPTMH